VSPRRRLFLSVVILLIAAVGAAVSARWLGTREAARAVPAPDVPGAVVLVPGYGGATGGVDALAEQIRATGREAVVVALPGDGTGDLAQQAGAVDAQVADVLRHGAPSVDVIGYSAGGVVARLWARDHDGGHKARRVITLGSPHHGTSLAAAGAGAVPDACPAACQQLAPGSHLLTGLPTPVPSPPAWLALWTVQDQTVTPPESARLEGALNVALQSICPELRVDHSGLPTSPVVTRIVLDAIGAAPLTGPGPGVCVSS
jgi:pimeloyl-ACP methyl ester carboxylesterase